MLLKDPTGPKNETWTWVESCTVIWVQGLAQVVFSPITPEGLTFKIFYNTVVPQELTIAKAPPDDEL